VNYLLLQAHLLLCIELATPTLGLRGEDMRSELVFGATTHLSNRYLLVRAAAQAIRKFHRPNARIADTTNEVLEWFGRTNPLAPPASNVRNFAGRMRRAA